MTVEADVRVVVEMVWEELVGAADTWFFFLLFSAPPSLLDSSSSLLLFSPASFLSPACAGAGTVHIPGGGTGAEADGMAWDDAGAGTGTGETPMTLTGPGVVRSTVIGVRVKECVVSVGAGIAWVRLRALTILLSHLFPSPRTTLLSISSIFICLLFSNVGFLPFGAAFALVVLPPGATPTPLSSNLNA